MPPLVILAIVLMLPAALAVGIMLWAGVSLSIDAWHSRHARPLSIADEAERWLESYQNH